MPIKSRVQKNEVKPKAARNNFKNRDKNNGFSIERAEVQTRESRLQGKEVKPKEGYDNFHYGDKKNEYSLQEKRVKLQEGFTGFQQVDESRADVEIVGQPVSEADRKF